MSTSDPIYQSTLRKYLGTYATEEIEKSGNDFLQLHDKTIYLTLLALDIVSITTIERALNTEELNWIQNQYFDATIQPIYMHSGDVICIFGDAVFGVFGLGSNTNHEIAACNASNEIHQRIAKLIHVSAEKGLPQIKVHAGINTGYIHIGNFGTPERFTFSVRGDEVNLASRLQGLCKNYGVDTILTRATYKNLDSKIPTRKLDSVRVKGRDELVEIFALEHYDF